MKRRTFIREVVLLSSAPLLWLPRKSSAQVAGPNDPAFMANTAAAAGGGSYTPNGVTFNGSNQYLTRATAFTGAVDSKVGTLSLWVKRNSANTDDALFRQQKGAYLFLASADQIRFLLYNSSATVIADYTSASTITDTAWHHIGISYDLTDTGKRHVYLDGSSAGGSWATYTDDTIDYDYGGFQTVAAAGSGFTHNGCLAELWFDPTGYMDLSSAANLQKFRTAGGAPVDLGATGNGPTGSQPILYLRSDYTSAGTNSGSGGDLTITNGPLTSCAFS